MSLSGLNNFSMFGNPGIPTVTDPYTPFYLDEAYCEVIEKMSRLCQGVFFPLMKYQKDPYDYYNVGKFLSVKARVSQYNPDSPNSPLVISVPGVYKASVLRDLSETSLFAVSLKVNQFVQGLDQPLMDNALVVILQFDEKRKHDIDGWRAARLAARLPNPIQFLSEHQKYWIWNPSGIFKYLVTEELYLREDARQLMKDYLCKENLGEHDIKECFPQLTKNIGDGVKRAAALETMEITIRAFNRFDLLAIDEIARQLAPLAEDKEVRSLLKLIGESGFSRKSRIIAYTALGEDVEDKIGLLNYLW